MWQLSAVLMVKCSEPDCTREVHARGLCAACYARRRRRGTLSPKAAAYVDSAGITRSPDDIPPAPPGTDWYDWLVEVAPRLSAAQLPPLSFQNLPVAFLSQRPDLARPYRALRARAVELGLLAEDDTA